VIDERVREETMARTRWAARLAAALAVVAGVAFGGLAFAGPAGAVPPSVDTADGNWAHIAARVNSNGSVSAKRFDCSSSSCYGSAWTNLGGFVTQVEVTYVGDSGWFIILGRGSDGYFWFRSANCPNEEQCTYGPWQSTGGFGYDPNIGDTHNGCMELTVIGGDRGVWLSEVCTWGAGGWWPLGGVVTDIAWRGGTLYAIDPWNRLWMQRQVDGYFRGNWNSLGGYVRWPVVVRESSPFSVAAVGADNAIWVYMEGVGWSKPALTGNVGYFQGQSDDWENAVVIQRTLDPYTCYINISWTPKCEALGGKVTSLSSASMYPFLAIGTDGKTYYRLSGKPWAELA
jgi:hypothetical protein